VDRRTRSTAADGLREPGSARAEGRAHAASLAAGAAGSSPAASGRRQALRALGVATALAPALGGCGPIEGLFFHPDAIAYGRPETYGLRVEDVWIPAVDGSRLHAWWLPAIGAGSGARGTVLHLHGNAGNVSNHLPLVAHLPPAGFDVLMLDYRGFGQSTGQPTLDGVVEDARAGLDWLRGRARDRGDVDPDRLVVFGQSLGGATALRLLATDRRGVCLGVIESAFASYRRIASDAATASIVLLPLLPLALAVLPDRARDPVEAVARIDIRLLFVQGTADRVVALRHSEQLYAAARAPRTLLRVEGAGHLEAGLRPEVRAQVLAAMREAVSRA